MLHRMTLRVVPALTVAVTEEGFRKRKRMVMLIPGLAAFGLYRILNVMGWHSGILALLLASGVFSAGVALVAYAYGRKRRIVELVRDDPARDLAWVGLRIGFLYGVLLSLMVLALLKVASMNAYSYLQHPDGPAMMAVIIASTSVARDAFELGHLRFLQQQGRSFLTFPDGKALWGLVTGRADLWTAPVIGATLAVGLAYGGLATIVPWVRTDLGQLATIGVLVGGAGTLAFVWGLQPSTGIREGLARYSWKELLRFFLWPGLTFAWTYYLVLIGVTSFLLEVPHPPVWWRVLLTAGVGGLMTLNCFYLGRSRWQEEKLHATIPPSLLRCPFILGILTSKKV
jgi:hypothetical protein